MMDYYGRIRERQDFAGRGEKAYESLQNAAWYLREVCTYITALEALKDTLDKSALSSEGMKGFCAYLSECVSEESYLRLKEEALALKKELAGFRVLITYEKERITITDGKGSGTYEDFLEDCFPAHDKIFTSPFADDDAFSDLEREIVRLYRKKHKDFFNRLESFKKNFPEYKHEGIEQIEQEMRYYLAYAQFQQKMEEKGCCFCTPESSEDRLMATGLYDLALAIVNLETGKKVVSNEACLEKFLCSDRTESGRKDNLCKESRAVDMVCEDGTGCSCRDGPGAILQ